MPHGCPIGVGVGVGEVVDAPIDSCGEVRMDAPIGSCLGSVLEVSTHHRRRIHTPSPQCVRLTPTVYTSTLSGFYNL